MIKYNKVTRQGKTKTWVCVVEGYRPGPGLPPRQRTIKSFGYLEDQPDREAFMKEVREFNEHYKDGTELRIEVASNALMYTKENRRQNYGYKFLQAVFDRLGVDEFIEGNEKSRRRKPGREISQIFRFLVLLRILSPGSKRANSQMRDMFYGMEAKFTLIDIYRALDRIALFEVGLQGHLNEAVKGFIGRDMAHAFYDVTNCYFEIDFPDAEGGLRQRGVSKEHRMDPIVGLGLLMDANGLPVGMTIFPGNTSESQTLDPAMHDVKQAWGLGRLVVVADKGVNSSANIDRIVNGGDGFVFSQSLRGTRGKRYQEILFDQTGYIENEDGSYRHKMFEEEYDGLDSHGRRVKRTRKVLIYWSRAEAGRARRKRDDKLKRAERAIVNGVYGLKRGASEYVKEEIVVRETGECLEESKIRKVKSVDSVKAANDAKYDGYCCIITSELEYDATQILSAYGGLWRIEQSFRLLKSDLYVRPVYVWTAAHIRAHFLICFTALLIVRIIQHLMGKTALSAERIATALSAATCRVLKGGIVHLDDVGGALAFKKARNIKGELVDRLDFSNEDQIALDYKLIQNTFGTDFYNIYPKQEVFNRFLKSISVS
jgi:hypothetical protein